MSDFNELINSKKPTLVDFYADWCSPCQTLLPIVEKLSIEYDGKVEIQKVNIDENENLAELYGIRSIPALLFINKGLVVDRTNGLVAEEHLRAKLNNLLDKVI
mgnify:CR=1 FL=1